MKVPVSDGEEVTVLVAENEALASWAEFSAVADSDGWATVNVTGLTADTQYHFGVQVEGGPTDRARQGRFRTHVAADTPHSFTFGASSCAGGATTHRWAGAISNAPVFDVAREADPLFFCFMDDFHYSNIGDVPSAANWYRTVYHNILNAPRRARFHREVPLAYMFGNHDAQAAGNAEGTTASVSPATDPAYRQCVPSYPVSAGALYHSFQVGRVLFILTDQRSHRAPGPPATMLGATQKQWFKDQLTNTTAELVVWFSDPWTVGATKAWGVFSDERTELGNFIAANGWSDKLILVSGHLHYSAFHDGSSNPVGGFREYMVSGMDSTGGSDLAGNNGPWDAQSWEDPDHIPPTGGFYLWGLFTVTDDGSTITVDFDGYDDDVVWASDTFAVVT